jgi:hypothetical protein
MPGVFTIEVIAAIFAAAIVASSMATWMSRHATWA